MRVYVSICLEKKKMTKGKTIKEYMSTTTGSSNNNNNNGDRKNAIRFYKVRNKSELIDL